MLLARRNLTHDRSRLVLSILGIGLSIMLVLLLAGFESGLYRQLAAYLEHVPGSLVVAQAGVGESLAVTSILPTGTLERIEQTDGVRRAIPVASQFVILDLHERKQPAYLVGYDPERGGGPWRIAEGRQPLADDEVVMDAVLAGRHGLGVGETFELMGVRLRIVGLSGESSSWMTSFVFMRAAAVAALLGAPEAVSYVFVTRTEDTEEDTLLARLTTVAGVEVTPKAQVIENDRALLAQVFAGPVRLMTAIAFAVGTLVVGLILYAATVERRREYGVLKAIGARNRILYTVTTAQALTIAAGGAVAGVALTVGAAQLVMALRPEFLITIEPATVALALAAGLAMALAGALVPARLVAGLAPAEVFRR